MSFNKYPTIKISPEQDNCVLGWKEINNQISTSINDIGTQNNRIVIECYQGCHLSEIKQEIESRFNQAIIIDSSDYMKSEDEIRRMTQSDVTDDRVFGMITKLRMNDFFVSSKIEKIKRAPLSNKLTFYIGIGASLLVDNPDLMIYVDMARWEIQKRMRKNLVDNIGLNDRNETIEKQYKRAYCLTERSKRRS